MNSYQLEQVIVFSRHGIRTPLPNTVDFLNQVTPKVWPQWHCSPGYLTTRGGTLESYFGDYFNQWLVKGGLKLTADDIFVYANSLQRTVATAQYFILGGFAGLDIPIYHKYAIEKMDRAFDPLIENDSTKFKQQVVDDLKKITHSSDLIEQLDQTLKPTYQLLSDILDYPNSALYRQYRCPLHQLPNSLELITNQEPLIKGAITVATAVVDAFILQYYSAFSSSEIAWGKLNSKEQWHQIGQIRNQYINLLYKSPVLSAHIAKPLIQLIDNVMQTKSQKFILLVGHDSNIAALTAVLGFDNYQLSGQIEETPIGGKVVIQRWSHPSSHQHYVKFEYIYQTIEQLNLAVPLSLTNPPQHQPLTLRGLKPNSQGLYLWSDFQHRITDYLTATN